MDMQSRPGLEDLVKYDVDNTVHQSLEENVEHAVSLLTVATARGSLEHRAESVEQWVKRRKPGKRSFSPPAPDVAVVLAKKGGVSYWTLRRKARRAEGQHFAAMHSGLN